MGAMGRFLNAYVRAITRINEWMAHIGDKILLLIMAVMVYEVFMRYIFDNPTIWVHEATQHIFIAYSMLGGGFVLVIRRHVNVNLLYERLSRRTQAILDLCTSVFFFAFVGVLTWQAMRFFYRSFSIREHSHTVFGPPMYPVKFMLVFVALLLLLQGVAKFIQDFQIALGKEEE